MGQSAAERSARYRAKDVEAYRERKAALARTTKHRETRRLYMQKWRETHRERHNRQARESQQRNKHKHGARNRSYHLRKAYGITQADYEVLLAKQNGACWICRTKKPSKGNLRKNFHVDHDHGTGKVRGLLCVRCNTSLGWYENNVKRIVAYLKR